LVLAAGAQNQPERREALASLCESYWYPLYAYLRRRNYDADEARDLTQSFFLRMLDGYYLGRVDPAKGRFRSFLLSSLNLFLSDERDRANAQKRGGGQLPFEISAAEELYQREPSHSETPERIYERRWARTVLDQVLSRLREEFIRNGRLDHFNQLRGYVLGQSDVPYADLAKRLGTSEGALKVGIHRLRKRYRDLLRAEIAATVSNDSEVDAELRYLIAALGAK
jgi:RNA polymerase sigma-70 factor (ECF subfamily)